MKRTRRILNLIIILLLVFQILGYLGTLNNSSTKARGIDAIAYYTGFNFALILSSILLIISNYIKRKIRRSEAETLIDSIGKS